MCNDIIIIMIRLMFWIFLAAEAAGNSTEAYTYANSVENMFKDLQAQYPSSRKCVKGALNKLREFSNDNDLDKQYAVALVNLYTRECSLGNKTFHEILNEQVGLTQPEEYWKEIEELLNQAMLHLDGGTVTNVYRACRTEFLFQESQLYRFHRFLSTTLNETVAERLTGSGANRTLFHIRGAKGLAVSAYSEFPGKKDVLLKLSGIFNVTKISIDKDITRIELHFIEQTAISHNSVTNATLCELDDVSSGAAKSATILKMNTIILLVVTVIL